MKEKHRLPGVRTSAVQYEKDIPVLKKVEESKSVSQPVRQGNKKYSVSPIYQKKKESNVAEAIPTYTTHEIEEYQQEAPTLVPALEQIEISNGVKQVQTQESGPTLVRKKTSPND